MKSKKLLTLVICTVLFNEVMTSGNAFSAISLCIPDSDQTPISFMKPVPAKIRITDRVDLSFIVNQSIVFQYRLKIEVPAGGETSVNKSLLSWSMWLNNDINNIIIPKLGKEGKYKLIVEYKTHSSSEVKKLEKIFEVYGENSGIASAAAVTKPKPVSENNKKESETILHLDKATSESSLPTESKTTDVQHASNISNEPNTDQKAVANYQISSYPNQQDYAKNEKPIQSVSETSNNVDKSSLTVKESSPENSNSSSLPLIRIFVRISVQFWNDSELSDFFGNNPLLGAGIEKKISNDFIVGAHIDFASKSQDEVTLNYLQYGAYMKYSWYPFGSNRPNVYGGLGIKGITLKYIEDGYSEKGSSAGFSAMIGVEIPLGNRINLDLGWDSVWSNMDWDGDNINVGNQIFSGGLIFSF